MKFFVFLFFAGLALSSAEQNWYNLRTTWMINPFSSLAFATQPRTVSEAETEGWLEIDNQCGLEGAKFAGRRFIRNADDIQMVLLFDVNGFIAGVQSPVPVANTYDNQYFDYENSPAYNKDTISGVEAYLSTAYFVDPSIICGPGRTQEEYDVDGTGYGLFFQNGPDVSAANILTSPLTEDGALAEGVWFKHFCFLNMGNHFFQYDYSPDQDCNTVFPAQLVYEDNSLKGFVFQHVGDIAGDRWEFPDRIAIAAIVDRPPTCLLDSVDFPTQRTMHFYFKDYTDLCII